MNEGVAMFDNMDITGACGRTAHMIGEVSKIILEDQQEKYFSRCLFQSIEIYINNKNIRKSFVQCTFRGCEIHMNGAVGLDYFQDCCFNEDTVFVEYVGNEKICSHYVDGKLKVLETA